MTTTDRCRSLRDLMDRLQALLSHGELLARGMGKRDPHREDVEMMVQLAHEAAHLADEVEQQVMEVLQPGSGRRPRRTTRATSAKR